MIAVDTEPDRGADLCRRCQWPWKCFCWEEKNELYFWSTNQQTIVIESIISVNQ